MTTIAFDLDGTLFKAPPGRHADDPSFWTDRELLAEHVHPIRPACELVRALYESGHVARVFYLTGRTSNVREVTLQQLQDAGLPGGSLFTQVSWCGFERMAYFKEDYLKAEGADLYVGDTRHDRLAADRAEVLFLPAKVFQALAGAPPEP